MEHTPQLMVLIYLDEMGFVNQPQNYQMSTFMKC